MKTMGRWVKAHRLVWLLMAGFLALSVGGMTQGVVKGPLGDYGDAPEGASAGYAHVKSYPSALFPTLFKRQSTPDHPDYVLHRFPTERVYLGQTVTSERNALVVDHDFDDGWIPGSFPICSPAQLRVFVTVPEGATEGPIYFNALFDWDHNGMWAGASLCSMKGRGLASVPEWAIRNLPLHEQPYNLKPGFQGWIELPEIVTGPVAGELWIRFTISTEPVDESVHVPVERGGFGWDGSGDFLYGETEDYFTCLLTDPENPWSGCPLPLPLAGQPSPEPPPLPEPPPEETPEVNAPPVAVNDRASTASGTSVTIDLLANDFDPEGEPLTVRDLTQPANGTAVLNADGTITYIPRPGFIGEDTFTYTICDPANLCTTATVTITVEPSSEPEPPPAVTDNNPPTLGPVPDQTVSEGGSLSVAFTCTDPDGDSLSLSAANLPPGATFTDHGDGTATLSYSPDFDTVQHPDTSRLFSNVQVSCSDGVATSTQTFNLTVLDVNRLPTAFDQGVGTSEDTPIDITLSCSDPDGDPLTFVLVSSPQHGTLTGTPPSLTYTPSSGFSGSDSFTFKCNDGISDSNIATVSIAVGSVNDAPVASSQSLTTDEDTPVSITLSCTDPDGDSLQFRILTGPAHGTLTGTPPNVIYTPDPNFHGVDSFTFKCNDGQLDSNVATVDITVLPVNDPPQIGEIPDQSVAEGNTLTVSITCTDADGDALTLSAANLPPGATFTDHGGGTGTLSYTPAFDVVVHPETSTLFDNVQITCSDGTTSTTQVFSITVLDVNRPPVAQDDAYVTAEDTPLTVAAPGVLGNDSDPDGDSLTATLLSGPAHGSLTLNADGSFTYTPDANFYGTDGFQYQACDPSGACDGASVTITITSVNDPPIAEANGPYTCYEGETITLSSAGSTDPDGTIVEYAWDLDNDGIYETTGASPTFNCAAAGTYTVRLQVRDDDGATATDSATVTVEEAPDLLCDDDPVRDTSLQVQWGTPSVSDHTATVTLSVTNTGSDDYAVNLRVLIQVLKGAEHIASSNPPLPYEWVIGNLAPGATATLTVTLTVRTRHDDDDSVEIKLQAIVVNEDCRPEHTEGKQDKVDIVIH